MRVKSPFCSNLCCLCAGGGSQWLCLREIFCVLVSRTMVRKGWTVMEVPNGWLQVLRGPRPPAARWPKAEKKSSQDSLQQRAPPSGVRPTPASSGGRTGRWRAGQEQRASPDAVRQEARERVVKLQRALEVLGETSGPEVDGLRSALEKARKLSSEPAVEVQITECKGFIVRAEKRVAELDAQRAREVAALEEGRVRLQRLEAEAACKVQDGAQSTQAPGAPPDLAAEVEQLRGKVIELQGQNRELQGSSKRQAIGTTPMCRPGPRLQEDFVPMCNEDIMRWMEDRQADIHEATTAGNAHEVARLCRVMGSAATEWSTPSMLPSMATNSVR